MTNLSKPSLVEAWGVTPLRKALRETRVAIRGAEGVPPSKADLSSLGLLSPKLGIPLWLGRAPVPRKVILTNLFNHTQTPIAEGWSTRRTQVRDFRGRTQTYDSHNGTDLCIPVGTVVVAPAAGRVARVGREFNRGGLKIAIDHGDGLITCAVHLARSLVREGDELALGQPYAVSGYSGLDGFSTFPWGIPHVHFNVWLDGVPVDPFAHEGAPSLWVGGQPAPVPSAPPDGEVPPPTGYDAAQLDALVGACSVAEVRARLGAVRPLWQRGAHVVWERNYYPTRFPLDDARVRAAHSEAHARRERLYMPFRAADFDGVVFRDEL